MPSRKKLLTYPATQFRPEKRRATLPPDDSLSPGERCSHSSRAAGGGARQDSAFLLFPLVPHLSGEDCCSA
jgi:hypothetical protein